VLYNFLKLVKIYFFFKFIYGYNLVQDKYHQKTLKSNTEVWIIKLYNFPINVTKFQTYIIDNITLSSRVSSTLLPRVDIHMVAQRTGSKTCCMHAILLFNRQKTKEKNLNIKILFSTKCKFGHHMDQFSDI
jgi:hypothetical protein